MVILGIDPGSLVTGYGLIDTRKGVSKSVAHGAIVNRPGIMMALRLKVIFDGLNKLIGEYAPDVCAIETAFYGKNAQSALKLGEARGVAMLAAMQHDLPLFEYSPREVKKALVGSGTASKQQVQYMVKSVLNLGKAAVKLDTTDALAVAICHLHRGAAVSGSGGSWKSFVASHPDRISGSRKGL
jgi:crossover junction endodeoxyribonuclease RuvC